MTAPKAGAAPRAALADLDAVREQVAALAADAERIAATFAGLGLQADLVELIAAARRQGIREGRRLAAADAREARARFTVIPGGNAPQAREGTVKAAPREQSGGAA